MSIAACCTIIIIIISIKLKIILELSDKGNENNNCTMLLVPSLGLNLKQYENQPHHPTCPHFAFPKNTLSSLTCSKETRLCLPVTPLISDQQDPEKFPCMLKQLE